MPSVSYVTGTTVTFAVAASYNVTLPSGINNNDAVVVFLMTRDTVTAPAGWTLVSTTTCTSGAVVQRLSAYMKNTVLATDVSTVHTFSQATSQRIGACCQVWRSESTLGVRFGGAQPATTDATVSSLTPAFLGSKRTLGAFAGAVSVINQAAAAATAATITNWTVTSGTSVADYRMATYRYNTTAVQAEGPVATFVAPNSVASAGFLAMVVNLVDFQDEAFATEAFRAADAPLAPGSIYATTLNDVARMNALTFWGNQFTDAIADGVNVLDALSYTKPRYVLTLADATRMRDDLTAGSVMVLEDDLGVADTLRSDFGTLLTDEVMLVQTNQQVTKCRVTIEDATRLLDMLRTGQKLTLAEGIGLADALLSSRALTVIDRLGLTPVTQQLARYGMSLTDTARMADLLRRFFAGDVVEGLGIAQAQLVTKQVTPLVAEAVQLAETMTPRMVFRLTAADTVAIDDINILNMLYTGQLAEAIEISALYVQPGGNITTWAINTRSGATTEYTGYDFNSFTQSGLRYLGASSSGLYALEGDTDGGLDIVAAIKSGYMQINGSRFAGLKAVYLGLRGGGEYFLKLEAGSGETYTYRVLAEDMATTKIWTGKGLRHRYLSFELITAGQDFDLDTIEFVPTQVVRRV